MIIFFDKNWCGKYSICVNYGQKTISRKSRVWGAQGTLMYLWEYMNFFPNQNFQKVCDIIYR